MKLTTQEAFNAFVVIQELPKLPVKASYRLNRAAALMRPQLDTFEKERAKLVSEFGTPDPEKSGAYQISAEKVSEFSDQMNSLLMEEIELAIDPVKLDDMGSVEIEPAKLMALGKLISE